MKKRGMMITAISAATAMLVSTAAPVLADAYTIANTPKCIFRHFLVGQNGSG